MDLIAQLEAEQVAALGKDIPDFKAGDTILAWRSRGVLLHMPVRFLIRSHHGAHLLLRQRPAQVNATRREPHWRFEHPLGAFCPPFFWLARSKRF